MIAGVESIARRGRVAVATARLILPSRAWGAAQYKPWNATLRCTRRGTGRTLARDIGVRADRRMPRP